MQFCSYYLYLHISRGRLPLTNITLVFMVAPSPMFPTGHPGSIVVDARDCPNCESSHRMPTVSLEQR